MATLSYTANRVQIATPYCEPMVEAIKLQIHAGYRTYDAHSKVWTVFAPHIETARRIVLTFFPQATEANKEAYDTFTSEQAENARYQEQVRQERERSREQARQRKNTDEGFFYGNAGGPNQWQYETGSNRKRRIHADGTYGPWEGPRAEQTRTEARTSYGPYETLYVVSSAPKEVVFAAFKALALSNHPDRGGNTETMQQINAAFDQIKRSKGW